jgi:hypothetical protein
MKMICVQKARRRKAGGDRLMSGTSEEGCVERKREERDEEKNGWRGSKINYAWTLSRGVEYFS